MSLKIKILIIISSIIQASIFIGSGIMLASYAAPNRSNDALLSGKDDDTTIDPVV